MSRVGKKPLVLPSGVKAQVENRLVKIEGPLGKLSYQLGKGVQVEQKDGALVLSVLGGDKQASANWGTARSHLNGMVLGVTKGWKKTLSLTGVGYTASMKGNTLVLTVGFSHEVKLEVPSIVKCTTDKTTVNLESPDKDEIGQFAAKVRKVKPPEPYLGKGIAYVGEKIRRKAGKTGK